MQYKTVWIKTKTFLAKVPTKIWLLGGGLLIVALYGVLYFIPKPIQFSYGSGNCVPYLAIAPSLQKFNSGDFDASLEGGVRIGGTALWSTELCVTPKTTPSEGVTTAYLAPFGGWLASKPIVIDVPKAPLARASDVIGKTISTAEPLKIKLTSADVIHRYKLSIADKATVCKQVSAELLCDVDSLDLQQGVTYSASLYQTYKKMNKKIIEGDIQTIPALHLTSASISDQQIIYDKPRSFSFTFDQIIESGEVKLLKKTGNTTEPVPLTVEKSGMNLVVQFPELARQAQYSLTIDQAIGQNGSSLAAPITTNFTTSGGPKVMGISIGSSGVARSTTVTILFDQPIASTTEVAQYVTVAGASASAYSIGDKRITFQLGGGDCARFTISVAAGIKSGSNNEASTAAWSYSSRMICGYTWTIGYSVQGRPIVGYSIGTGGKIIMFTGGMHGSELSGYQTMQAWAEYLRSNPDSIPAGVRVVVVPNTNPDGVARGVRDNARGVNIDRNFPDSSWQSDITSSTGAQPGGGGPSPGSEPETRAVMQLTRELRPRLQVSFHAQGRLVGSNRAADADAIGQIYANATGYSTMFTNADEVMGYTITGQYEMWEAEELGLPAILIELPTHRGNYLNSQLPALRLMLKV